MPAIRMATVECFLSGGCLKMGSPSISSCPAFPGAHKLGERHEPRSAHGVRVVYLTDPEGGAGIRETGEGPGLPQASQRPDHAGRFGKPRVVSRPTLYEDREGIASS